jgi:lipoprotein-releasing system ATP-binding protein
MAERIIRTENLTKIYRSGEVDLVIFSGLSLEICAGESVALVGESGVGKSTLLHLLAALDRPTAGEIYFQEEPLSKLPENRLADYRNQKVGYVWQNHHLLPEFSALENVMMPLLIRGVSQGQAEPASHAWLASVGLAERAHHRAGELSGGEQQRVAVARALVADPPLLIADEPTGNLDQKTGEAIIDLLVSLPRTHQLAAIVATHNLTLAGLCDRVLRIEDGRCREETLRGQESQT